MEAKLGGRLFDRDRANIRLTDLGILVRPELARIDRSATEAKRKAAKFLAARSVRHQPRAMEAFMRTHHVVAVIAVLLIGLGAKLFFLPATDAEASIHAAASAGVDVLQMHVDHPNIKDLPVQKTDDMTFVFSNSD
jgi:hypothetical protein